MTKLGNTIEGMAAYLANPDNGVDLENETAVLQALRHAGYPGSDIKLFAERALELAQHQRSGEQ